MASILKYLIAEIVIPLLKDAVFMLVNSYKIRQLRKEKEAATIKAVKEYEEKPSSNTFNNLP
jgi:hypothetical protein